MGSAIDRVVKKVGDPDVVRKLASELTAPDLTTLMMAVAAERASHVRGSDVLARYRSDRFSRPGTVQFRLLRDIEDLFIRALPREEFDPVALNEHLAICVAALSEVADSVEIIVSTADTRPGRELVDSVRDRWQERPDVAVTEDPQRLLRQRYYRRACFKINAVIGTETVEIGDGGFTDWTQRMLEDRHERLLISGVGLDRPALALGVRSNGTQDR